MADDAIGTRVWVDRDQGLVHGCELRTKPIQMIRLSVTGGRIWEPFKPNPNPKRIILVILDPNYDTAAVHAIICSANHRHTADTVHKHAPDLAAGILEVWRIQFLC